MMEHHVEFMESISLLGKGERQLVEKVQADNFWNRCKEDGVLAELTRYSTSLGKEQIGIADASSYDGNSYVYSIATPYDRSNIPEGYTRIRPPASIWIKFRCVNLGADNTANRDVWTKIYSEFFPKSEYEPSGYQLEVYPCGDGSYPDELSEIWISARKKPREHA